MKIERAVAYAVYEVLETEEKDDERIEVLARFKRSRYLHFEKFLCPTQDVRCFFKTRRFVMISTEGYASLEHYDNGLYSLNIFIQRRTTRRVRVTE